MKALITLLLFVFVLSWSFAQNNYQDVIYLKNGSIIRGVIIEQIPNKTFKIETEERNVFVFEVDEIDKITKEYAENKKPISDRRKGYIGISMGASIPVGGFADISNGLAKTGIHINLLNFGYLFSENFGVCATWFGAANALNTSDYIYTPWAYGGIMAGPLLSYQISEKVEWDFRPMFGYSVTTLPDFGPVTETSTAFAFNIGTQIRVNVAKRITLLFHADFFHTQPEFVFYKTYQNINTISIGSGVAYRLK